VSGGRFALLIASDRFTDAGLVRLVSPSADVAALGHVLADREIGGFEVRTLVNRPSHEVARSVEAFFADRRRDDLLLFYFTGHGLKDDRGRLFFAMTDTERRYLGATALAAGFLHDVMERSRSRSNVLVLDCCYSGAFATSRTAKGDPAIHTSERFRSRGRAVLTASDSMQFSFEGDTTLDRTPLSVFTGLIVEGLSSGDADRDANGLVDVDELYDYVDDRMRDVAPQQQPGKWQWDVQGRIVIANSRRGPGVAPPPARIAPAVSTTRTPSRRTVIRAGAGAAVLAAGGLGALRLFSGPAGPRPWVFETGDEVYSSPAVHHDTVYIASRDGNLYALDLTTGARRWRHPTGAPVTSSPAVAHGAVYVGGDDGALHAVDAVDGTRRWTVRTGAVVHSSPAVAGDAVYVGSRDANLYAVDAGTGALRWRFPGGDWFNSSPAVAGGTVYIGCRDHNVYAVDAATGQRRWSYLTESTVDCSALVAGGMVLVGSDDKSLYALDGASGSWIWQFDAHGGIVSSPTLDRGAVYFGCDDGALYAIDATSGRLRWRFTTGNSIRSSPTVDGGVVYVASRDRNVYAIDTTTGEPRWRHATNGPIDDSSPVVAGGLVVVGSLDHNVYALPTRDGVGG